MHIEHVGFGMSWKQITHKDFHILQMSTERSLDYAYSVDNLPISPDNLCVKRKFISDVRL